MTRKYNIKLEAQPMLVCMKNTALGECLKANTCIALGFASCCISLSTHPLMLYYSYTRAPVLCY